MAGQLSYTQSMWVRFPQLRSCFSCVTVAQLICNQPVVGSNPTAAPIMLLWRNGSAADL